MSLSGHASLEEHHVWLRFVEIGNRNWPSRADFVAAFVLGTEFLGELINDCLVARTDRSHLDEKAVEKFNAFFWVKNPCFDQFVVFGDRQLPESLFLALWLENRC